MNRKAIAFASLVIGVALVSGCGGSGPASTAPTGPTNPGTTIELTNAPATLGVSQAVSLRATLGSDAANGGVDWSCTPSGSCGAFSPAHTANGATTSYTAPAAAGTVMIVADATDDSSATASANISVVSVASNSVLNGPYVFFVEGTDSTGIYVAAGTIITDGDGNITDGEQDYADQGLSKTKSDPVTGIYSLGSDGRGSITLIVNDAAVPNGGVETFSIAATSATHALIIEFDGAATSGGTLDFQAANALSAGSIAGSYSFALNGYDLDSAVPAAFGGVANLSAAAGFVSSGAFYANDGGTTQTSPQMNGPVTGPDAFGRGTIRTSVGLNFVYYAVQGEVLRIVEDDLPDFLTGGAFVGQGAAGASASFSNAALSGPYTFFESGSTTSGRLSLAGQFTADGSGNLSAGFADTNDGGMNQSGSIAGQGVYSIPGNGTGTLTLPGTATTTLDVSTLLIFPTDPSLNLLDPNSATGGGGALILDFDNNAIGTGMIVPQALGAFDGGYAVALGSFDSAGEENFVGQSVANGSGSLAGMVDLNDSFATVAAVAFTGSSTADSSNLGRYTGRFTVGTTSYSITYYQASGGEFFILDTDSSDVGNGFLESQGCPFIQGCS